jgi:hypothetical protein
MRQPFDVEGGPCAAGDLAMVELDDLEIDLFEREGLNR